MPSKSPGSQSVVPQSTQPYLRKRRIIPGRPLLPGRKEPLFPAFCRLEEKPVTFRENDGYRTREEREECVINMMQMVRKHRKLVMVMIPYEIYLNPKTALFHAGWTLNESDGEIRTFQCVMFLRGEAVLVGLSDQGVICVALDASLSAWDGRTEEESRAKAA